MFVSEISVCFVTRRARGGGIGDSVGGYSRMRNMKLDLSIFFCSFLVFFKYVSRIAPPSMDEVGVSS